MFKQMDKIAHYYLGADADKISHDTLQELVTKLKRTGHTYCSFWAFLLKTYERHKVSYKSFLLSDKIWDRFIDDRNRKPDELRIRCGLELRKFQNEAKLMGFDYVVENDSVRVMPLIKYLMGLCVGVPDSVCDNHKEAAKQQLREEPVLFDILSKLSVFFPITKEEVMRNE